MEVAIVGGGIVGLSSAYYLAQRGAAVTVYEKGSLGNGSTERSAGGIRQQYSTPVNVKLSKASIPVWENFEEEFGVDIDYRRPGYLFLAREEETAEQFAKTVAMQNDLDVPTQLLDPDEASEIVPELHRERFERATYLETDGYVDPHLALQGIAQTLPEVGAELHTNTEVTDVLTSGDGVTGVEVDGERVETDFVVNAAGPWARNVAAMAGIEVPAAPRRRQVLVVDPEKPVPETLPLTIDLDTGGYFRPEREGASLVGGHFDEDRDTDANPDRYSESTDMEWSIEALEYAEEMAGYFGPDTGIKRGWAGLYSVTPDHHPVIEETIPGFVSAIGFSGHGFQHAPATGQIVSEIIYDGEAKTVDVSTLNSDRFESGELIDEQNVA